MDKQRTDKIVQDIIQSGSLPQYIDPQYVAHIMNNIAEQKRQIECQIWSIPGALDALHRLSRDPNHVDDKIRELFQDCFSVVVSFGLTQKVRVLLITSRRVLVQPRVIQMELFNLFSPLFLVAIVTMAIDAKERATNTKLKKFISAFKSLNHQGDNGQSKKYLAINALQLIHAPRAQIDNLDRWEDTGEIDFDGFQEQDIPILIDDHTDHIDIII